MDEPQAALQRIDGRPMLRFERKLAHPPAKVWKAITDPAEMAHWFPAAVDTELKPGATMRFTFPDAAPSDVTGEGEVLEFDPPKVYAFRWNTDVLRFELVPDGSGCRLVFSQTLGGGWVGRLTAGRARRIPGDRARRMARAARTVLRRDTRGDPLPVAVGAHRGTQEAIHRATQLTQDSHAG